MSHRDFGFLDNPANGLGIVRARTLIGNLRSWEIPRSEEALAKVIEEIGSPPIPGLYLLFAGKKVYVGQTENLQKRLQTHMKAPDKKIKSWDRAILINDGRNSSQSDFNDENIRLALEDYLVKIFKINGYTVTTMATRTPVLSSIQDVWVNTFKEEIFVLLSRKSRVTKPLTGRGDDEVYNDEVRKILERNKYSIQKWSRSNKGKAIVNNKSTFLRAGSQKPKGWQITFRGASDGSFKASLEKGDGLLLVPRGPVLLIPLQEIKDFLERVDPQSFTRNTIDVFIQFEDDKVLLVYKREQIDITRYTVNPFP